MDQSQAMSLLNCSVNGMSIQVSNSTAGTTSYNAGAQTNLTIGSSTTNAVYTYDSGIGQTTPTLWGYWQNYYYPYVIRESYPVYIQEKSMDKGKQAFELLKALMDQGLIKVDKVKDFILAMDTILKTL